MSAAARPEMGQERFPGDRVFRVSGDTRPMASLPYRPPRRAEAGDAVDLALRDAREAIDRLRATLASLRPAANGDGDLAAAPAGRGSHGESHVRLRP